MAKTMSPSAQCEMTDGQIEKATDAYRAMLRKHRSEFGSEAVQQVLMQPDYLGEQLGVLRRRVEAVSNMIVRHVKVDRNRTPQLALDATGRKQYTDRDVVNAMPRGEGEETDVFFFKLGHYVSDDDLEKECEIRGLKSDPVAQAAINEGDPAFADEHPNGCHWKDSNGAWCFAAFDRWTDERDVSVGRGGSGWYGCWWFGGVRK